MKIGILGGSFDPPHIGHYLAVKQILEIRKDIEKILLVPAFQHQWKPIQASVEDRLSMLSSLVDEKIEISDIELQRKGVSYTVDTVRQIKNKTKADIFWIVGSDILSEFHRWEKTEELLSLTAFLVFPRDPFHLPKALPKGFEVVREKNLITTNISSTLIRKRVKEERSIHYLVPEKVELYIKKCKLYT
ncbi:nicotinate (nicotinamide) nucleotide adenylyltransferase [Candidatus Daviesbacteria bacterium]|nr:nicotinate (nicotinamide) nucleotide adenylyltransferase [Candidatus Daviesbacteria bacterium]